jgi:periplasmic divalent cation tolerance protein
MDTDRILSLTTTVGSEEDARRLAGQLLGARLAACVQVEGGLVSHYRWQGAVHADPEWRITVKSLPPMLPALRSFMAEHHPYELPQLLWQQMDASTAYADWVRSEVAQGPQAT